MDGCLLSFDFNNKVLQCASANNPIWIYRKSIHDIEEKKPDKQSIGKSNDPKPFTTHCFELSDGDIIYVFTDGFADQFGGPGGKKYKYKQMEQVLMANRGKSFEEQKNNLRKSFDDWKGNLEQVDDVCVIGVKI